MISLLKEFRDFRAFVIAGTAMIAFSNLVVVIFTQTVPAAIITFFKEMSFLMLMGGVFIFMIMLFLRLRPIKKPKNYFLIVYDVFGNQSSINGIRTNFRTHDVGWSYMKQYKKSFPLYNFALVSAMPNSKKNTIFKYI